MEQTTPALGKNARKKLAHRQRTARYFDSIFGILDLGQDEVQMRRAENEVQRRIERNMNHGFDWHPDGAKIVVNFSGAARHRLEQSAGIKAGKTAREFVGKQQNDGRALQYLLEKAVQTRPQTV